MKTENLINFDLPNQNLTEIFNFIDDILSIMDEDLNILWTNEIYHKKLGKQYKEIIGKKCYYLWHHLKSPCPDCPCVKAFKTDKLEIKEVTTPEGRHFILFAQPFKTKEGKKLVFEIAREITEKKISKERYIELLQTRLFNRLINDFSHHLKNIFTGIYGFAQLLKKDIEKEKSKHYFQKLIESIDKGMQFLNTLEKLKNIETEKKIFDLNYLLISMEDFLKEFIDNEKITLNISIESSPSMIKADPFHIRELLIELIKNAKKSIVEKGIIDIKIEKIASKVILKVNDTGIGMSEETLNKCFEPFFTTNPQKFGLGLTLAKSIVEKMNGSIEIESKPSLGTTVRVYFPEATLPQEQDT